MALVTQFLTGIRGFVINQEGDKLAEWLQVEPGVSNHYHQLAAELRSSFPRDSKTLSNLIDRCLPEEDDVPEGKGSPWAGFNAFMLEYMQYWRDVDFNDPVKLHSMLSNLLNSCANAFGNPTHGALLLRTSTSIAKSLCKLVRTLQKQPQLLTQVRTVTSQDEQRKSIAEVAADILQKIFTSCIMDRSSQRFDQPKGRKLGVYTFANLILKLLISSYKSHTAVQMLVNIDNIGPPLHLYPASQRVTYLYYLGRLYYNCAHYMRAQLCLASAYTQCPPSFLSHRRQIISRLIPTNLLLGRFPSQQLLSRPECAGLAQIFLPICRAIQKGDFVSYYAALKAAKPWLEAKQVYEAVYENCKTLVWRSLTRRTFLLTYQPGDGSKRVAPVLQIPDVLVVATYIQRRLEGWVPALRHPGRQQQQGQQGNSLFMRAVANSASATSGETTLLPPPGGRGKELDYDQGLIFGNMPVTLDRVRDIVVGLVAMGLLNGFVSYSQAKFAIEGTKKAGSAVAAGWPNVYRAGLERMSEGPDGEPGVVDVNEVPGCVKRSRP